MSGEQTSNEMKKIAGDMDLTLKMLKRSTQWENLAELYIGLMKEAVRKDMKYSDSPLKFWDYCAERKAQIHNLTAKDLFQLKGSNPITATFGDEGDISNLCEFEWFDWCYYCNKEDFPHQQERLGRVLGPAKNEGNEMAQWILKDTMRIVPRRSVRPLTEAETRNESIKLEQTRFMEKCRKTHGDKLTIVQPIKVETVEDEDDDEDDNSVFIPYEDYQTPPRTMPPQDITDDNGEYIGLNIITDQLIGMEVVFDQGKRRHATGTIISKCVNENGRPIGTYDHNPKLNSCIYNVELKDGTTDIISANNIANEIWEQVDTNGYSDTLLHSILDCKFDSKAVKGDGYVVD